jgi:hypothetical protein
MNIRILPGILALALAAAVRGRAADPAPAQPPQELTIVIVGELTRGEGSFDDYARVAAIFTKVFNAHKWPLKISAERFASNNPDHDLELRVFMKRAFFETPGELSFQAWMTLFVHDKEHDFGIIKYRYPVFGANHNKSDILDATVRGAAEEVARRIEAILFPSTEKVLT